MGNFFNKKSIINNNDLYQSLLQTNLEEKIIKLEEKIDFLDNKLYVLEANTQANLKVISADINFLSKK